MSSTASGSSSDSDSYIDRANITPTTFTSDSNVIDITPRPAVMTWRASDGKDHCLSQLNLDMHYDASASRAFFRLRAAAYLKSHPRTPHTPVWLFIHPERIRILALNASPSTEEARTLGPGTICLHFEMSRLPALVVPKESFSPRRLPSGELLDSLRVAVQQATFSIYAKIPSKDLSRQQLAMLCLAVSRNEIKSTTRRSDISSLYAGDGGEIIEGDSLTCSDSTTVGEGDESAIEPLVGKPPSYNDVPPGPPPALPSPHKRRRLSSPGPRPVFERSDQKHIEQICAGMLDNKLGQLSNRLDQLTRHVTKQLQHLEARLKEYVDDQLTLHIKETLEKTEDEYYGLKVDLENYIGEEVKEAEVRILDELSSASFSIHLDT